MPGMEQVFEGDGLPLSSPTRIRQRSQLLSERRGLGLTASGSWPLTFWGQGLFALEDVLTALRWFV